MSRFQEKKNRNTHTSLAITLKICKYVSAIMVTKKKKLSYQCNNVQSFFSFLYFCLVNLYLYVDSLQLVKLLVLLL